MTTEKKPSRKRNPNGSGNISTRKDGRYELKLFVDAPDGTRKRVSVYGATWEEADAERTRLKELQRKGVPVDITTMTVGRYLTYWLEEVAYSQVRGSTYRSYEQLTRLYLVPGLGKRKLRALQAAHVRVWLTGLRTKCQCCAQGKDARRSKPMCCAKTDRQCCRQYPSVGTVRCLLRVLRAALQHAVDGDDLLTRNVARQVRMPSAEPRKIRPWSQEEVERFLEAARGERLYALWAVGLGVGLRRGEALGLRWQDVDFKQRRLEVRQSLQRVHGKLYFERPKTDSSENWVPLTAELLEILRQRRRDQVDNPAEVAGNQHDLVFTTKIGTPLEPRNINRAFEQLCRQAGVRKIRVHDLRHSCATLLFAMGVDAATVQRILRHSSITVTTGTYMEVIEEVRRDALSGMDALLRARPDGDDLAL